MADQIQLSKAWTLGAPLGSGGFGRVFEATSPTGEPAALKLIPKEPGAARELLFEKLTGIRNIVPIIDSGEWGDSWVLVMPRAEQSLHQHLAAHPGPRPMAEVIAVLADVTAALEDLEGKVVHRDIKPENILRLGGRWCLADFGIARYAEASTSIDTRKHAFTPAYAAPERWRAERATTATDIYAVGVIAYEMVEGRRPFLGPRMDDFREQHLTASPPPLVSAPPSLASVVVECLLKAPAARPRPANVSARLTMPTSPASAGVTRLRQANAAVVARTAEESAAASAAQSLAERRRELQLAAIATFAQLSGALSSTVRAEASSAIFGPQPGGAAWEARLGPATLGLSAVTGTSIDAWGNLRPVFDVVAHASVQLLIPRDQR